MRTPPKPSAGRDTQREPKAFGKITSEVRPRHAVAYHISTWHDLYDETFEAVRVTYDGPLTIATDEQVVVREASVDENAAPTGTTEAFRKAEREPPEVAENWISDDINAGRWEGYRRGLASYCAGCQLWISFETGPIDGAAQHLRGKHES